jgi:dephospho-CoA kinase
MKPVVIGFSGKIGSGKTTISSGLARSMGCHRVSFGEYVRGVVCQRGLLESREVLQSVGESLLMKDAEGFCRAVLAQANWECGHSVVIDGVRHRQVVDVLRRLVAPMRFVLVFVVADDQLRDSRLTARGGGASMSIEQIESHSTEREVTGELQALADIQVDASLPIEEIILKIRKVVE